MTYTCFSICGPGLVRADNQDNLYINGVYRQDVSDNSVFQREAESSDSGLFAVADGMGGEKHGELASLIAVQEFGNANASGGSMTNYLIERNNLICKLMKSKGGSRIGSTFAGLQIIGNNAEAVNVGDSRIYLFRRGELTQLSYDHTATQQMINLGMLDKTSALNHPDRHKLTQHLGIFPSEFIIEPHTSQIEIQPDDVFLLCSDGLTDMLDDMEIENVLCLKGSVADWVEMLYTKALYKGGKDNITILLLQARETNIAAPGDKTDDTAAASPVYGKKYISIAVCAIVAALLSIIMLVININGYGSTLPHDPDNAITITPSDTQSDAFGSFEEDHVTDSTPLPQGQSQEMPFATITSLP